MAIFTTLNVVIWFSTDILRKSGHGFLPHLSIFLLSLVEIFLRISQKLSSIFSFFNFLRNSGRFFRFLQKVVHCLRKLQNEKFNIQRKAEKLQISDKF